MFNKAGYRGLPFTTDPPSLKTAAYYLINNILLREYHPDVNQLEKSLRVLGSDWWYLQSGFILLFYCTNFSGPHCK